MTLQRPQSGSASAASEHNSTRALTTKPRARQISKLLKRKTQVQDYDLYLHPRRQRQHNQDLRRHQAGHGLHLHTGGQPFSLGAGKLGAQRCNRKLAISLYLKRVIEKVRRKPRQSARHEHDSRAEPGSRNLPEAQPLSRALMYESGDDGQSSSGRNDTRDALDKQVPRHKQKTDSTYLFYLRFRRQSSSTRRRPHTRCSNSAHRAQIPSPDLRLFARKSHPLPGRQLVRGQNISPEPKGTDAMRTVRPQ